MTAPQADRPLIVTALLDDDTQQQLITLRRRHFPVERNHLAAHLTLFHHLEPTQRPEIERVLHAAAERLPLPGHTTPPRQLGHGVAIGIGCPQLIELRAWIAHRIPGVLTGQDAAWGWPHVTVQNKVSPAQAKALHVQLGAGWESRPLSVVGLGLWRYLGGPWQALARWPSTG